MKHPQPHDHCSPQVAKICAPDASPQLRKMAASGLVPLGPADLLNVLYTLRYSTEREIADLARQTLAKLPDQVLLGALSQEGLSAAVLDGLALEFLGRPEAVGRIILARTVADETIVLLATRLHSEDLLEMIAANEQRLLACPAIIEALYMNPSARMSTVDRAVELAVRQGVELEGIPAFAEIKAAILGGVANERSPFAPQVASDINADDLNFLATLDRDEWLDLDDAMIEEALEARDAGENGEASESRRKVETLEKTLLGLNTSQKIRLATLGNASARSLLVRDSNKLVSMAAIKSPQVTENEAARYAQSRALCDDVIRYITHNRDWTKSYQVKLALVQNPRAPLADALRFMQHLRPNDIRALERNKNVSGAVANGAKQLRSKREGS